jgi:hypothetical protein
VIHCGRSTDFRSCTAFLHSFAPRIILLLQLVIQMQSQLSDNNSSSDLLKRPDQTLSFVKHALEAATISEHVTSGHVHTTHAGLRMDDLRIVDRDDALLDDDVDSDDELPADAASPDDEMTETAVNLLLSILEGEATGSRYSIVALMADPD